MRQSDATIADYFCKGIETAIIAPELAHLWADNAIAQTDEPNFSFIEVSLSKTVPDLISALRGFSGNRDQEIVGRWLLGSLLQADVQTTNALAATIRKAMLVCHHCNLGDDVSYELDGIDDGLYLARHDQYGTVAECRDAFLIFLQENAKPFSASNEA